MKCKTPKFNFLITVIIMIANILCVLWTPFRNRRDLTHPKSMKRFITYIIRLFRESRTSLPGWPETGLKQQGEETGLRFRLWLRGGAGWGFQGLK